MKKTVTIFAVILLSVSSFAQSPPQKMSYQAIIRNSSNALVTSTTVGMQITILQASSMGGMVPVYVETQTPTTNVNGLVSIEVGAGTVISGTFSTISWANGPFYIKTETDPAGGTNYSISGTSQLLSVPYAFFAEKSGSGDPWLINGNALTIDHTNFIGTTDDVPLNFRVNNIEAGRIDHQLNNVFFGNYSGINTTGGGNTAVGTRSLKNNISGAGNTAIGQSSLESNISGGSNIAIGATSLTSNISGSNNNAFGAGALGNSTTGSDNVAIGTMALMSISTGSQNTALGSWSNALGNNLTNTTVIGYGATTSINNTIRLGNAAITNVKTAGTVTAGTVTYPNTLGNAGDVLTLPTSGGVAVWTAPTSGSPVHYIGEYYGGGMVFYVYDGGLHGLIAATTDQSTGGIRWYGGSLTNTRARADGIGAGLKNTAIIIANQGSVDGQPFAATVCNEYSVNVNGITYGDWYLPSKYELNLLYLQKNVVGGFVYGYYMSSTEYDINYMWLQYFYDGTQVYYGYGKAAGYYVRAIRAF